MPKPYPKEFRDDVVRVALNRDEKTTIAQIAKDFGVHEGTVTKWIRQAEIDAGNKPGVSTGESIKERQVVWLNWFYGPEGPCADSDEPISGDDTARSRAFAAIEGHEALYRYGVDVDTGAFSPQCCCGKNTTVYSLEAQRRALGRVLGVFPAAGGRRLLLWVWHEAAKGRSTARGTCSTS